MITIFTSLFTELATFSSDVPLPSISTVFYALSMTMSFLGHSKASFICTGKPGNPGLQCLVYLDKVILPSCGPKDIPGKDIKGKLHFPNRHK